MSELRARGEEPSGALAEQFAAADPALGFVRSLIGLDGASVGPDQKANLNGIQFVGVPFAVRSTRAR